MPKWLIWLIFILIVLVIVFLVLYFNNYFDRFGIEALHYDKENSWIGKIFGAVSDEMAAAGEELNTAVQDAVENAATPAPAPAPAQ
jgi:ABC-type multidrug transport system fused ATPase/permease subunit